MEQEKFEAEEKKAPKAKWVAAPPGLVGIAYPSAGMEQDLIGRIPSARARGIIPEPSRGKRKLYE